MKCSVMFASVLTAAVASAAVVSNITWSQDPTTARVTVNYDLAENAIVTFGVSTNGCPIGDECLRKALGDVNRRITPGSGKSFHWFPASGFDGRLVADGSMDITVTAWNPANPPDYMVCDLSVTNAISYYPSEAALPLPISDDTYKLSMLVMRRIHATGKPWRMGSPEKGEKGDVVSGVDASRTVTVPHVVMLTNDYYIGVYPVTQKQYYFMTGGYRDNGVVCSEFNTGDDAYCRPVEKVSWTDLRGDSQWPQDGHTVNGTLTRIRALTGLEGLDLPTEAEWEFACRAGTDTGYNSGLDCTTDRTSGTKCPNLAALGWYGGNNDNYGNSNKTTHPVGLLKPNAWGLYDMHGNVWEWCLDWYSTGDDYTSTFAPGWKNGEPTIAPVGPSSGKTKTFRGGNWFQGPLFARSCYRFDNSGLALPTTGTKHGGFRLVSAITGK